MTAGVCARTFYSWTAFALAIADWKEHAYCLGEEQAMQFGHARGNAHYRWLQHKLTGLHSSKLDLFHESMHCFVFPLPAVNDSLSALQRVKSMNPELSSLGTES